MVALQHMRSPGWGHMGAAAPKNPKLRQISLFSTSNPAGGAYSGSLGLRNAPETKPWYVYALQGSGGMTPTISVSRPRCIWPLRWVVITAKPKLTVSFRQ